MAEYRKEGKNLFRVIFHKKGAVTPPPDVKRSSSEDLERHALSPLETTISKFETEFVSKLNKAAEFYGATDVPAVAQAKTILVELTDAARNWQRILADEISKYEHMNFFKKQRVLETANVYKDVLETFLSYKFSFDNQNLMHEDLGIFWVALKLADKIVLEMLRTGK